MSWGKTRDAMEAAMVLDQAILICLPRVRPAAGSHLYDFLVIHFPGEEVKLIKKMVHHLKSPQSGQSQAELGE
ncbi:Ferritin light chain [Camelus dromedarius]|uniref:Ferritin light chain n=1 Tax=Camelus dromedarius TaxID=9838 RepID=A0A5N4DQ75_CAMDR|nr:Ferritin light chain [Camelus dromedarius]